MKFEDISTLLTPEELPYLSGVERLDDGTVHVAVLTRMPGVSPEMIRHLERLCGDALTHPLRSHGPNAKGTRRIG